MEKDNIYFDDNGLTSTSANFVANQAKEYCQTIKQELDSISFLDSQIALVGSTYTPTGKGITDLSSLQSKLDKIAKCNSLIAWLREALKAKENLAKENNNKSLSDWCHENGREFPKGPEYINPITKDDVLATWSIKDRNRYLALAAKVSAYGKFIHPDGPYSSARALLKKHINEPVTYSEKGRDTLIIQYTPSVDAEAVDTEFFLLQGIWRKAQAELNGYEHKISEAINADTTSKNAQFVEQNTVYQAKIETLSAEFKAFQNKESQRIAKLKIIIPHDLEDIYNEVTALSK